MGGDEGKGSVKELKSKIREKEGNLRVRQIKGRVSKLRVIGGGTTKGRKGEFEKKMKGKIKEQ